MLIYKILFPNGKMYIGQTQRKFNQRKSQYKSCFKNRNDLVYKSIRKYGWENVKWEILEDDIQDLKTLNDRETFNILKYDTFMPNGYNMTLGGDGSVGHVFTDEQRKNMSNAQKGKKGRKLSIEELDHLRKINLGRKHTEETKKKMSDSARGKIFSDEHIKNLSISRSGKIHTEETKVKIGDSHRGKSLTIETKKKIAESHKGKTLSQEHRLKISNWYNTLSFDKQQEFKQKTLKGLHKREEKECCICHKKYLGTPVSVICSIECKRKRSKEYMKEYFQNRKRLLNLK